MVISCMRKYGLFILKTITLFAWRHLIYNKTEIKYKIENV